MQNFNALLSWSQASPSSLHVNVVTKWEVPPSFGVQSFTGVSFHRHDWLNHWTYELSLQLPSPSISSGRLKAPALITHWVFLTDQSLSQVISDLSVSSGVNLWCRKFQRFRVAYSGTRDTVKYLIQDVCNSYKTWHSRENVPGHLLKMKTWWISWDI